MNNATASYTTLHYIHISISCSICALSLVNVPLTKIIIVHPYIFYVDFCFQIEFFLWNNDLSFVKLSLKRGDFEFILNHNSV